VPQLVLEVAPALEDSDIDPEDEDEDELAKSESSEGSAPDADACADDPSRPPVEQTRSQAVKSASSTRSRA
jgi:hypothetical protein